MSYICGGLNDGGSAGGSRGACGHKDGGGAGGNRGAGGRKQGGWSRGQWRDGQY